jgi:hypothetical protein
MTRLVSRSILAAVLIVAPLVAVDSSPAGAVPTGCDTGPDDFDGNGGTDLAIGAPRADQWGGRVYVEMKTTAGSRQVVLRPPKSSVDDAAFGSEVGEVDLSDHSDATVPCSNLVVGNRHGTIFIYRWDRQADTFALLNRITQRSLGPTLHGFGLGLATEIQATSTPAPREPVLYVGAVTTTPEGGGKVPRGAVVRLVLDRDGSVASDLIISPGEKATVNMPLTRTRTRLFGYQVVGTTDPDEVIISAPESTVHGHVRSGAVLDWRRGRRSELITESTPGVPRGADDHDRFGATMWLGHEAAAATGTPTSLFIAAPEKDIGDAYEAGAVWQMRYRPSADQRIDLSSARVWTQGSPGIFGRVTAGNKFGYGLQATSITGGRPEYAALTNLTHPVLVGLGTGTHYPVPPKYASAVSAWHDITDNLADDPFPATTAGHWSSGVVVSHLFGKAQDGVQVGLRPDSPSTEIYRAGSCSPPGGHCDFGAALTDTGQ